MRKKFLIMLFVLFTSIPWSLAFWNHSRPDVNLQWFYREATLRKKYHKLLLEEYNLTFEQKTLDLISENSLILTNLRKDLKA